MKMLGDFERAYPLAFREKPGRGKLALIKIDADEHSGEGLLQECRERIHAER
jgi:hypothetical protein